jgi:hypothetical protein
MPVFGQKNAGVRCGLRDVDRLLFKQAETIESTAKIPCGEQVEVMSYFSKNKVYEVRRSTGQTGYLLEDAIGPPASTGAQDSSTPQPAATQNMENIIAAQSKMIADLTRRIDALESRVQALTTLVVARNPTSTPTPTIRRGVSDCSPAIESTISGEFSGWDGETIFKLDDGQIWEQAEYSYMYSYQYRPDVTIYETASGCRMKVEDEDETIIVKKLR